jgi:hypothetical protein
MNSVRRKNKQRIQAMVNFRFALFVLGDVDLLLSSPYLAQGATLSDAVVPFPFLGSDSLCIVSFFGSLCIEIGVCLSLFSNGIVSLFVFTSFTAEVDIV